MDFDDINLEDELNQEILYDAIKEEIYNQDIEHRKAKSKSKKKKNTIVKRLSSTLKVKTVLILLITLIVNTYAWFIFISTVYLGVQMHVKNWNFKFSLNDTELEEYIFKVDQIYPGMDEAKETITAQNSGETSALVSCKIKSIEVLGEKYSIGDEYDAADGTRKTHDSASLLQHILNDYPFKLQIIFENDLGETIYDGEDVLMVTGDSTQITFKVNWEYETGADDSEITENDKIDTEYGEKAYEYAKNNSEGKDDIIIEAEIIAVQAN